MTSCRHRELTLLPEQPERLRCRHCHLTIKVDELSGDYCPECFEIHGEKRNEFEKIRSKETAQTRYRCEKCGIIINGET